MGEKAFWDVQQRVHRDLASWDAVYANRPRFDLAAIETYPPAEEPEDPLNGPRKVIKIGAIILGVGLGTEALGLIFFLASGGTTAGASGTFYSLFLVLGVTVGPILLVGGLLTLIVGAIMYGIRSSTRSAPKDPTAAPLTDRPAGSDKEPPPEPPLEPNRGPDQL